MNLKIDMQNPAHIKAAAAFFISLAAVSPKEAARMSAELVPEKPAKTRLSPEGVLKSEAKVEAKVEAPTVEAPTVEAPTVEASKTEEGEVTREDLILLVSELSSNVENKNAMRSELDKLGAKNTRSLTTDKYKPFYNFLTKLKNVG